MKRTTRNITMILVTSGLTAAAITVATMFIKIPAPLGYIHAGDAFIFIAAALLGPYAAIPAALGSFLADILGGFVVYAPATLVVKALMGLLAGFFMKKNKPFNFVKSIIVFSAAELIMVCLYFVYELLIYSLSGAIAAIPFNLIQGCAGVILGVLLVPLVQKLRNF